MLPSPRLRLLSLALLSAVLHAAELPPGRFVEVDADNTRAVAGTPSPFFTADLRDPASVTGPQWRLRAGFGFNTTGNRDVFEKSASGAGAPLVTTIANLEPGRRYGVYVGFLSVPGESWRVKAGLSADKLTLFTPAEPEGRVTDLGRSAEPSSNRNQYLGFIGNAVADSAGTLTVYSDDGDSAHLAERSWLDGFLVGEPYTPPPPPPLPGDATLIAPDGAWTWFNDERAIVHRGSLLSGYVLGDGRYGVTRHDLKSGESHHMIISTPDSAQRDDHNNPSLTVLPDGRILALYSKHIAGNRYFQRTSLVPLPSTDADWGPEIVRPTPAANTYANTHRLSGDNNLIYNFHRCINFNPTLTLSADLGETWGEPRQFIGAGNGRTRPYIRLTSDHERRIDVIYTDGHPRDVNNSLYHLYYRDGMLRRTDDTLIKPLAGIPLNHDGGERGSFIYQYRTDRWPANKGPDDWIPGGRAWNWDVHYGADGRPVVAFQVQRDNVTGEGWNHDRIYYFYATWTGREWRKRFIAHAGRGIYAAEDDYGGGMAIDPEDPRVVYISSNAADPFKLDNLRDVPLRANDRYELWRGFTADGGLTFTWTQLTVDSAVDNLRPIVPENHGRGECVLWFSGNYRSYTSYKTQVLARLGDTPGSTATGAAADTERRRPTGRR